MILKNVEFTFNFLMKILDFIIMKFKYFMLLAFLFLLVHFLFYGVFHMDNPEGPFQDSLKAFFAIVFIGFIVNFYARYFFPENFKRRSGFFVVWLYYSIIFLLGFLYIFFFLLPTLK